jgi:hypothetical protein
VDDDQTAAGVNLPGSVPFVLTDSGWNSLLATSQTLSVTGAGRILAVATGSDVGFAISQNGSATPDVPALTLGMLMSPVGSIDNQSFVTNMRIAAAEGAAVQTYGYVAIVADGAAASTPEANRIIGFGWLADIAPDATPGSFTVTALDSRTAPENASLAVLNLGDVLVTAELLNRHYSLPGSLLTPALVR